jgi:hypothetical protein
MAVCPSCGRDLRTKSLFQATGLSGVVCPFCGASLRPKYWSSTLLLALALVLATLARMLAQYSGIGFPIDLVIWLLAFVFCFVLFSPWLVRLRSKQSPGESLKM